MRIFMGMLSGTSMDGIDCALIDVSTYRVIEGLTVPYSEKIRYLLNECMEKPEQSPAYYAQLNRFIGEDFALAANHLLKKTGFLPCDIDAIGSHGQTICHSTTDKPAYTVQLGCPHTIADRTGITVVADFRTRDLVINGQGAPFAPLYHEVLFGHLRSIAIINIGGLSNITYLHEKKEVFGYDIGPGNCLIDAWIESIKGIPYDENGEWAKQGNVMTSLLDKLMNDPYFKKPYPKSIGKEYFSLGWLKSHLPGHFNPEDIQATLTAFTAATIAQDIKNSKTPLKSAYISGGGVYNLTLMRFIQALLKPTPVASTNALNVNPDYIEAGLFAWLAKKTIDNEPVNLPFVTGASYPSILGAIYPKNPRNGIDKSNSIDV